jgi:hypothetical protein
VSKTKRLNIGYGLFFLFIQSSFGIDDTHTWTSIGFEKNLPHSFSLEIEQELRIKDQLSTFSQTFSEVSLSYKVIDGLNISIPYRYAVFDDKIKQRLSLGASYKYKFNPISLKYRTKLQRSFEKEKTHEYLIRNKLIIEYKLSKKIEPFFSGELFHQFNTNNNQLDEYRVSFGLAVDLPRKSSIKIFYIFKNEDLTKTNPDKINVFGLSYTFKL